MDTQSKRLIVTAVEQVNTGIITAFINEVPALVVQGKNRQDVEKKLVSLLHWYIKRLESSSQNLDIQIQSI